MIKLNIQLFGGGTSAEAYDKEDTNPDNNMLDISIGQTTYSFPQSLFKNVGAHDGRKNAEKGYVAAVYAAYYAATGKDPYDVAREEAPTTTTKVPVYDDNGNLLRTEEREVPLSGKDLNDYILNNVLAEWVKSQGGDFTVAAGYNSNNLEQLYSDSKSFQNGIQRAYNTGAVKINGQAYTEWKKTQPQFQEKPEGYSEEYGMPVAKSADGKTYIYKDPTTGAYILPGASSQPQFSIGSLVGFTDMSGTPVRFDATGSTMMNADTDEEIIPNTELPTYTPPEQTPASTDPREEAYRSYFNRYYDDVMTTEEGTMGKRILDNNTSLYEKEAENAAILASTGMQAQAMSQAQAVKQATDAVRSERMAQLRAGMSESQLADRELQMLMGSVNQLSQQAQISSQELTAAQLASSTAKENAFNDYIAQATQLGQNAAANYASEVGDAYALAAKYMREAAANGRSITWDEAYQRATGAPTS